MDTYIYISIYTRVILTVILVFYNYLFLNQFKYDSI